MNGNTKEVIIWLIVSLTILGCGLMLLAGNVHDSDNEVRIIQIKEDK